MSTKVRKRCINDHVTGVESANNARQRPRRWWIFIE